MSLLEIRKLTHSFGEALLYENAELTLNKGEHIGIVGQNGAGKSTLIKICTNQILPDAGTVLWQKNITVEYLDQYAEIAHGLTMVDFLKSAFCDLYRMEEKMLRLYQEGDMECLERADRYRERLERAGFYSIDTRIERAAHGLGLSAIGLECPIDEMSGGQRAKVILAKLLLADPDVLLLDEPTNFLDQEHVAWLTDYLSGMENAFLVVSHDAEFLDKITNRICDIDEKRIVKYYGAYSEFLKKKTFLREDYVRRYSAQQKEIRKTEEFIRKNIAGRKSKMARGRRKQLERIERLAMPEQQEMPPLFSFSALPLTDTEHLIVRRLAVGYAYPILSELAFAVKGGQKVALSGFNGIGKSTLLKTLIGQIPALGGQFHFSTQVVPGYFAQDLAWCDSGQTPIEILADAHPGMAMKERRRCLAQCGILSRQAMQPVGSLSGGEQAKLKLCLLTLTPCNFLILDEPTNHLDAQAKDALKDALIRFSGTVLLVSHEEHFYKDWIHRVICIGD